MQEAATRSTIRFMLDAQLVELDAISPTTTVLNYLREHLNRTGTKEGCAEGDCGACMVVLAELQEGKLQYRAVNACIQFAPVLDGKALFTVESLKANHQLHPIQQAMVECHASQCGFCTPGFVMSLFALYKTEASPSRERLCTALSGNLCRCTGYRPILEVGQQMQHYAAQLPKEQRSLVSAPFEDETGEADLVAQLQTLQSPKSLELATTTARYFAPQTATELANYLLEYPDARILAGGTDMGLWVTKQHRDLNHLVYIGAVTELAQITQNSEFLEIGAAVRLEQAYQVLVKHYPELNDLYERFASLPIRNAGTLVGNVANGSPIGDSMPALIALGARVILQRGAEQRSLALEDFYLGYQQKDLQAGEFVRAVQVPLQTKAMVRTWKISKRFGQDISAVCAAFAMELAAGKISAVRIAFGGMAATPKRARQTEQALLGQIWSEPLIDQAIQALQQDFQPLNDMRASAQYRQLVAANLLRKFYLEVTELKL